MWCRMYEAAVFENQIEIMLQVGQAVTWLRLAVPIVGRQALLDAGFGFLVLDLD